MCGQITHTRQRANAQAPVRAHIDCRHGGQRIDIEEVIRKRGPVLDEAEEVRPARDKGHSPIGAVNCNRTLRISRPGYREGVHLYTCFAAALTAATMLG
jgi:hypothetical protein